MTGSGTTDAAAAVIVTAFGSVLMLLACLAALVARLLGAPAPRGTWQAVESHEADALGPTPVAARLSV